MIDSIFRYDFHEQAYERLRAKSSHFFFFLKKKVHISFDKVAPKIQMPGQFSLKFSSSQRRKMWKIVENHELSERKIRGHLRKVAKSGTFSSIPKLRPRFFGHQIRLEWKNVHDFHQKFDLQLPE